MLDLRFTPNITKEGIKSIYSVYIRGSKKKNNEGQIKNTRSALRVLLFDEKRNKQILSSDLSYVSLFDKLIANQYGYDDSKQQEDNAVLAAGAAGAKILQQQAPEIKKVQLSSVVPQKAQAPYVQPQVNESKLSEAAKKSEPEVVKQVYNDSELTRWKKVIIINNSITASSFPEDFNKDFFFADIFVNFKNLQKFNYDFFLSFHRSLLNDNIMNALALVRFSYLRKIQIDQEITNLGIQQEKREINELNLLQSAYSKMSEIPNCKYLDFSNNTQITEIAYCRFFLNCNFTKYVKTINLQGTLATDLVIEAILASRHLRDLSFIQYDKCPLVKDFDAPLLLILNRKQSDHSVLPSLNIKQMFCYYLKYLKDETISKALDFFDQIQVNQLQK